ncbi:MAG: SDR family oxidoreductase [Alphaproteobacteria bacterium]|nr:SDR family oxidoreductase [Alphaproteobacteria bacterium]
MSELFNLTGKTAFITGTSSGLGEQLARCLSAAGARVILAARRIDRLEALALELGNSLVCELDVRDQSAVEQVFNRLNSSGEKIDICINNAGIADITPIFENDDQYIFERIMQTNLIGVWYVTKQTASHMRKNGICGSIINIGSINGNAIPAREASAYCISKAAVIHLTKTLVGELSPHKIRINCISPGWFKTPMNGPDLSHIITDIPLGIIAKPTHMDGLILYLASNKASQYVTGSCITVDGGMSWGGKAW